MSLLKRIDEEMIKALKSGDTVAVNTLRGLKSDCKYFQIDKRLEKLSDDDILTVIGTAAKKRRDSIEQFLSGGRQDLVDKETRELEIILTYLPTQLGPAEIETLVREAIAESGAASPADMGKVMKVLMPKVKGKADGKLVSQTVTRLLSPS
jgi:uncharacterized protein YqeY